MVENRRNSSDGDNNDSDLHDLLAEVKAKKSQRNGGLHDDNENEADHEDELAPLNLEHLSMGELDVPVKMRYQQQQPPVPSCLALCCAYWAYFCEYAPTFCWTLALVCLLVPSYFLIMAVFFNPTEQFGLVKNDYTDITSQYDLSVGKIDHWCLGGDNDSCRCEDPLQPQSRGEWKSWTKAHVANKELVNSIVDSISTSSSTQAKEVDICFLGGSVIEEMDGRWFGERKDEMAHMEQLFQKNFDKQKGGAFLEGVALGIAGDTNPSVLWRILNGEMPSSFNPKIWWLEVGLNDLGRTQCSEEVVVLGILRIVEEILVQKPNAKVVINSLFPLADLRGGMRPESNDYRDSFTRKYDHNNNSIRREPTRQYGRNYDHPRPSRDHAIPGRYTYRDNDRYNNKNNNRLLRQFSNVEKTDFESVVEPDEQQEERQLFWFGGRNKRDKEAEMRAQMTQQRKYNPITHKERKFPLWTSITAINAELKKFCNKHDRVYFFDSTEIFAEREEEDVWILKREMISFRGHPTVAGMEQWEAAVVDRAMKILRGRE